MGDAGRGDVPIQLPHLGGNHDSGRGVHAKGRRSQLRVYMGELAARLRGVRVACGDWSRVCGDCVTWRHGITAVFLDPPYAEGAQQYAAGGTGTGLSADVREWAIAAGERRDMRVILCGLDGEHEMPSTWRVVPWKAGRGYGGQRSDGTNDNRHRERLWVSPHCLGSDAALPLFAPRPAAAPVADPVLPPGATPQEVLTPQAVSLSESVPANVSATAVEAAALPSATADGSAAAASPSAPLRLVVERESWVEVKDGEGNLLLSQKLQPGSDRTVDGKGRFTLVIGNASGVRLSFRGQPVDLAPYTRSEVARLTLE
jgi:hypothetical protein